MLCLFVGLFLLNIVGHIDLGVYFTFSLSNVKKIQNGGFNAVKCSSKFIIYNGGYNMVDRMLALKKHIEK